VVSLLRQKYIDDA